MAIGDDIFEVVLNGVCLGQDTVNRFFYKRNSFTGNATDLLNAFQTSILPAIKANVTFDQHYVGITVTAKFDTSMFATWVGDTQGLINSETATSVLAWSIELIPLIISQRAGGKRIGGIAESDLSGNAPTGVAMTRLASMATVLGGTLNGIVSSYKPHIPTTRKVLGVPTFLGYEPILAGIFRRVSTQRSRLSAS